MRRLQYIVGVFFCCHNLSIGEGDMDIKKICDKLIQDNTDIPITYIVRIIFSIFDLLGTGEYFYN